MSDPIPFEGFPKIGRWKRNICITEKIDGTNGQIYIPEDDGPMLIGSRTRWITPEQDNAGFARWCKEHEAELRQLGPGRHFGEWWGSGIQRTYGLKEKRFSLFNAGRWSNAERPACVGVVPVLYFGIMDQAAIDGVCEKLRTEGSAAAPGFMKPEGIIIFHTATQTLAKRTLDKDEEPKGHTAA
jgi:RNA ligase